MKQTKEDKLNSHPTLVGNDQIDDYLAINGLSDNPHLETATIMLKVLRQSYLNRETEVKEMLEELASVEKEFEGALDKFHNLVEEHKVDPGDVISMYDIPEILAGMSLTRGVYMATDIVVQILEDTVPDAVEIPSMKLSVQALKDNLNEKADLLLLLKWQGEGTPYKCDYTFADRDTIFAFLYGDLDNEVITFSKRQNDILDKYGIN